MKTDLEQLQEWFEEEKKKGLVDIKFSGSWSMPFLETTNPRPTVEQVAKEINDMNAAIASGKAIQRTDVF